jgi:YfiH family protein
VSSRSEFPLLDGRRAVVVFTDRHDGDLHIDGEPEELNARRRGVVDAPWTWLRQVHGSRVVTVTTPGEHAGVDADGAITAVTAAPLAVQAADCAPIALVDSSGAIGVIHAGWRGLVDGVVESGVAGLRARNPDADIHAVLGACIHPSCYEFSEGDLSVVADRFGDSVRSTTHAGTPALDLPAAVRAACDAAGVPLDDALAACTACGDDDWYSHRARRDSGRHAVVAWIEPS